MKKSFQVMARAMFLLFFIIAQAPVTTAFSAANSAPLNSSLPATAGMATRYALSNPGPVPAKNGYTIASADQFAAKAPALSEPRRGLFGLKASAPVSSYSFSGGLEIEPITAYNLIVDSNVLAPSSYGPNAASLGARFCNRSGATMNNVVAYIGDYTANTPGTYPQQNPTTNANFATDFPQLSNYAQTTAVDYGDPSRFYALEQESGSTTDQTDATRYIGTLANNQCVTQYWLVSYPRKALINGSWVDVTGGVKPDDDLWLKYDFWASNGVSTSYYHRYVTMRNEISAMANKIWPNGDNKVPQQYLDAIQQVLGWSTWIPGASGTTAYPGDTITSQGIWYDMGVVGAGFDNNYDLVPDRNAWLQPIGDASAYDPGCFRLVRTYGLVIVKLNDGSELLIPFVDQLYFENVPDNNTGAVGLVFYEYIALDGACTAGLTPYQEVASGYDNEKFNADFGAGIPPLTSRNTNMTFVKGTSPSITNVSLGGTINYTLTFTLPDIDNTVGNFQTVTVGDPSVGAGLTYYDVVPVGVQYAANSASTSATMTNYTSGSVAVTRMFSTDGGTSWTTTDPGNYTSTSTADQLHIKWTLSQGITSPASGAAVTGTVGFTVNVLAGYTGSNIIENNACMKIGDSGPPTDGIVCDDLDIPVSGTAAIQGTVWADAGAGGGTSGDGLINGAELGIFDGADADATGVTVSLYWDNNADGDYADAGDFLYGTTTTESTATGWNYCFDGTPFNGTCTTGSGGLPETSDSGDDITNFIVTTYDIVNGLIDVNNDGQITAADDATNISGVIDVIDGWLDMNSDGFITTADDGTITGTSTRNVYNGYIDADNDGNIGPRFIVVVDSADADIPTGYGPTTTTLYSGVSTVANTLYGDAALPTEPSDFGFAPALSVQKRRDTPSPVTVGGNVQFTLTVRNTLPGNGTNSNACVYYVYPSLVYQNNVGGVIPPGGGPANSQFIDTSYLTGPPDGRPAYSEISNNTDYVGLSGFNLGNMGGNITSVEYVIPVSERVNLDANDSVIIHTYYNNVDVRQDTFTGGAYFTGGVGTAYELTTNITSLRAWSWSDFSNNLTEMQIEANKGSGSTHGDISVDTAAFRITTDGTCGGADKTLSLVPLIDEYNSTYLQFISANPPIDSGPTNVGGTTNRLSWSNLGPLYPGQVKYITVTFKALATVSSTTNVDESTGAYFASGRPANSDLKSEADNQATVAINPASNRNLTGRIFDDNNNNGWQTAAWSEPGSTQVGYDTGDTGIPNIPVDLYVCVDKVTSAIITGGSAGKTCAQEGGKWVVVAILTTTTNAYKVIDGKVDIDGSGTITTSDDGSGAGCTVTDGLLSGCAVYKNFTVIGGYVDVDRDGVTSGDTGDDYEIGEYGFFNLAPGYYYVDVHEEYISGAQTADVNQNGACTICDSRSADPDTSGLSTNPFPGDLDANASGTTNVNFGYNVASNNYNIGDTIYYDWDGDGVQDAFDEGISGVTVQLLGPDGFTAIASTTTNSSGQYLFSGYPQGFYTVKVLTSSLPAGVVQSGDPDGSVMDNKSTFNLAANDLTRDFGYKPSGSGSIGDTVFRDMDGNGVQGGGESGMSGVTVQLQVDMDGNGTWVTISTQVTNASGYYLFTGLPAGTFRVVIDRTANASAIPNDGFGNEYIPSNGTLLGSTVYMTKTLATNTSSDLTADFGFSPPASIGDTIYLDVNGNGTQDLNEPGISGVTVTLYTFTDANNNSKYDYGEAITATGQTDVTDPDGVYNFTGLTPGYYAVVVTPPAGSTLTGDPSVDGFSCLDLNNPADPGEPSSLECDHRDGQRLYYGTNYTGADFGYQLPGSFGDALWVDTNNDGIYGPTESGIPDITITATTANNVTVNGVNYPAGTTLTTVTDANGNYTFNGIVPVGGDATWTVSVSTADPDFPAGLTQTYDPDGTLSNSTTVVMNTAGVVLNVGGCSTTPNGCDGETDPLKLDADFGYDFTGGTSISGTICLETTVDGVCGTSNTDPSGTGAGETAFGGVVVYLYKLVETAPANGQLDPGETTILIATAVTDTNGDYTFTNIPDGNYYVIAVGAPMSGLDLTSSQGAVNGGGDGGQTTDYNETTTVNGDTISTNQVVNTVGSPTVVDRDFAFTLNGSFDFGDDPVSYAVNTEGVPDGARHKQPVGGYTLYLGTIPDTESNGQPSVDATGDGGDENGMFVPLLAPENTDDADPGNAWEDGVGVLEFTITGSGWLVGWVDWNNDGDFNDANEMVLSRAVTAGSGQQFNITTPTGVGTVPAGNYYMRFRVFTSQPGVPAYAYSGAALNGEVEDYRIPFNIVPTPVTLSYFNASAQGGSVKFEWSTVTETGNVGFNLYDAQMRRVNDQVIASKSADSNERQDYSYTAATGARVFYIEDVALSGETLLHGPFTLGETYGSRDESDQIDWSSIQPGVSPASRLNGPALAMNATSTGVNLKVSQTGLYRVTFEMLRAAGFDFSNVASRDLKLTNRGVAVPMYVFTRGARFGAGSYIEFYGQALDTLYTDTNVYRLEVAKGGARVSSSATVANRSILPPASFTDTLTVNNQNAYASYALGTDPWYDTYMMVYNTPDHWDFSFNVTNLANPSAPASLKLTLWGLTQWPAANDHHVIVSINGVTVGDISADGFAEAVFTLNIPANTLQNGANTLRLTLPGDRGVDYDVVTLDKFSVTYQRSFQAVDGQLAFTAAGKTLQVTGLPTRNVVAYRIDPVKGPVRITNIQVSGSAGNYSATFAGSAQAVPYVVSAVEALRQPAYEAARLPVGLSAPAQYLIISHPAFMGDLQSLIQARQAQGFTVNVVDVNDVYAQYSGGVFDPQAIKDYVAYAQKNLGTQYVLLVGGDTSDYRNYVSSSISFIPSPYVMTGTYERFVPADSIYADTDGDKAPEVALGRFPVRTTSELSALIQKTLSYSGKDYGQTAVFVADKFDGEVSFKANAISMAASLPSGWSVENIYLDNLSASAANTQLLSAMNRGSALVVFTGHSGPGQWTFPAVFNTAQAANLANTGRPFVALQWGCWDNYYVDPRYNYLVQSLLLSGDRGAAASLGSVSRADARSEETLSQVLLPRLVTPGMTIGQALQLAKTDLAHGNPSLLDMLYGFTIMGDPALVIQP